MELTVDEQWERVNLILIAMVISLLVNATLLLFYCHAIIFWFNDNDQKDVPEWKVSKLTQETNGKYLCTMVYTTYLPQFLYLPSQLLGTFSKARNQKLSLNFTLFILNL